MTMRNGFLNLLILPILLGGVAAPDRALGQSPAPANTASAATKQTGTLCPEPALSRLTRHRVAAGETVVTIAQQYNLIPATLMGLNPNLREGNVPVGTEILVPPYNGIRVEVPSGSSWRDIAAAYGVRADALYEINGCQDNPRVVFIPGINWSPNQSTVGLPSQSSAVFTGYPLPATASVLTAYGWQTSAATTELVFHSGVDLAAEQGTPVLAVGSGTVAFVGEQGAYGNLIVVNHAEGLQTRYAQLAGMMVEVGQRVNAGDRIGTVGSTGVATAPHLHFEVRSNSDLGWVAQDPVDYVRNLRF